VDKHYAITVYVDGGPKNVNQIARAAVHTLSGPGSGSSLSGQNGHVFLNITNGHVSTCMGYYGKRVPLVGGDLGDVPIRIEPYVAEHGWSVKKTYPVSEEGYHTAFQMVEKWNTDGKGWAKDHHCGDFAEAVLRAAGVHLVGLESGWAGHRPGLWEKYLLKHGGQQRST
jgi:hypothetical protein